MKSLITLISCNIYKHVMPLLSHLALCVMTRRFKCHKSHSLWILTMLTTVHCVRSDERRNPIMKRKPTQRLVIVDPVCSDVSLLFYKHCKSRIYMPYCAKKIYLQFIILSVYNKRYKLTRCGRGVRQRAFTSINTTNIHFCGMCCIARYFQ